MTVQEMIQKIRDPDNWSDDFFSEIRPLYLEHLNTVRNTLVKDGLWDRFDTAFSEWQIPGQAAVAAPENAVRAIPKNGIFQPVKSQNNVPRLDIEKASSVIIKEPEWLIPGYIPKYGITTIAGEGGVGKTSIWCSLVASITTGKQSFLLGGQIPFENDPEDVLVLSAEDSWSYVLRRRLEACGADLDRIGFLSPEDERFVDLNFNGDLLKGIIETNRPSVIVFDPLQAFVPENLRMGDRNAMRKCFSPLIGYGEQYKLTPIIIAHANKQSGVWGRKRIADSSDIWDASRSVLMVGTTAEDGVRYISHEKSNWGRLGNTVLFTLEDCVPTFKC